MDNRIMIFDTTLRDGEQSPGCSMTLKEKIKMAKRLEKLNVDVIEAGFAIASKGDFESVQAIAKSVDNTIVASLARALKKDIDRAYEAVKVAKHPRIHTFLATSEIHRRYKLKMSKEEVLNQVYEMVNYAKSKCSDIEFSAEDATRTRKEFLIEVFNTAAKAGANIINIPDTVGYTTPDEFYELVKYVKKHMAYPVEISVHCHNDLGLAVANSLAAIKAGATQIECTINGIGERAGNAALEELTMVLETRKDLYNCFTGINHREIMQASNDLTAITGVSVQPNKAIVGENAFSHEAGIHQHGVLNNKSTYEIMAPDFIGRKENKMVLGKHSGMHAFKDRVLQLGYDISREELSKAFKLFKDLADKKKEVYEADIEAIIRSDIFKIEEKISLEKFVINYGNTINPMVTIALNYNNKTIEKVSSGDGVVDASFKAIEEIFSTGALLKDYKLKSISKGKDALGEARVKLLYNDKIFYGVGLSTDVVEASIKSYINALNKII